MKALVETLALFFVATIISIALYPEPAFAETQGSSEGTAGQQAWNDDRLVMALDEIERLENLPDGLPPQLRVPPKDSFNYAKVVVSVSHSQDIFLLTPDFKLVDSEGGEYKKIIMGYEGGNFKDRTDVNSLLSFGEGAIFTSFYEIPIKAKPSNLIMNFDYLESLEEENKKEAGKIVIKVTD